ncbi:transcriptional regulator, GntR family [Thalassovita litoralis]|jgi:DNA-binding GntR family transcriptional regulator|uniref:Transcriptional regulator, GntR family n=1 Tax=Thalassovita litoralis TaxID=1010611 RepID=A0A521BZI4_9RHOB|nr:GntR family transcriptional regulator [Thalassovita litoralis]SMO52609.1 transcriptional regulator, GntR family [Thalassovita litoralis]
MPRTPETNATPSSSAAIVRDVIRGLYEGRYVPGQRLAEPDLVADYGLSRGTVREALKQLASDGVVIAHPYKGAQIRSLTRPEAANIFAVTEVILGLAARQAAHNIDTPGARETITTHFNAIAAHNSESDRFEFIRQRNRYFRALIEISGNDELRTILPRLQVHLIRNRLAVPPADRVHGYHNITQAVLEGAPDRAEQAARSYVAKTAACVLPHFPA